MLWFKKSHPTSYCYLSFRLTICTEIQYSLEVSSAVTSIASTYERSQRPVETLFDPPLRLDKKARDHAEKPLPQV